MLQIRINLQDIVESGLPWLYVIYGNELETHLATSTDPVRFYKHELQ